MREALGIDEVAVRELLKQKSSMILASELCKLCLCRLGETDDDDRSQRCR